VRRDWGNGRHEGRNGSAAVHLEKKKPQGRGRTQNSTRQGPRRGTWGERVWLVKKREKRGWRRKKMRHLNLTETNLVNLVQKS